MNGIPNNTFRNDVFVDGLLVNVQVIIWAIDHQRTLWNCFFIYFDILVSFALAADFSDTLFIIVWNFGPAQHVTNRNFLDTLSLIT